MEIQRLIEIVAQLRDPATGCPWDLEQTHKSLIPHLIEEAYEVIDAIQSEDNEHIAEELGDLLLQVVLHAQIARESGTFDIESVAAKISEKLVKRHPHVFGSGCKGETSSSRDTSRLQLSTEEVESQWERIKGLKPLGSGIPAGLPETLRASKILRQMRKRAKIATQRAVSPNPKTQEELGDSLLGIIQAGVEHNLDPHLALRNAIDLLIEEANEDNA